MSTIRQLRMWMRTAVVTFMAASHIASTYASTVYPISAADVADLPDRGGRIGITVVEETIIKTTAGLELPCLTIGNFFRRHLSDLAPGDSICFVNDVYFEDVATLKRFIRGFRPGEIVSLTYFRAGTSGAMTTKWTLSDGSVAARTFSPPVADAFADNLGILPIKGTSEIHNHRESDAEEASPILTVTLNEPTLVDGVRVLNTRDTIYSLNGVFFSDADTFFRYVGSLTPGSTVSVDYVSATGKYETKQLIVREREAKRARSSRQSDGDWGQVILAAGALALLLGAALSSESNSWEVNGSGSRGRSFDPTEYGGSSTTAPASTPPGDPVTPIDPFYGEDH